MKLIEYILNFFRAYIRGHNFLNIIFSKARQENYIKISMEPQAISGVKPDPYAFQNPTLTTIQNIKLFKYPSNPNSNWPLSSFFLCSLLQVAASSVVVTRSLHMITNYKYIICFYCEYTLSV